MIAHNSISSLNGFCAPSQGAILLNDQGREVGRFDREWTEALIVWKPGKWRKEQLARADSWESMLVALVNIHQ